MPDDFFAQEQKMAVRAMASCCKGAWQAIQQDTNIEPWIRKRPLTSLAVVAAGGLVAGYLVARPRDQQPKQTPNRDGHDHGMKSEHRGFLLKLEDELAHAIGPVLQTFAASSAGAMFSDIHHGYTNGKSPNGQAHDVAPPPGIQI